MNTSFTSTALTGAGLAVGLALLAVEHVRWWKKASAGPDSGGRDPKLLIPFWSGIAFGTLMVACPAGLLGTGAGILRWGGNSLGDLLMSTLTGQHSTTVATASAPQLDGNGALVLTAVVLTLWLLRKQFAKLVKRGFKSGVWTGTLLAIGTGTFALIGNLIVPNVNNLGAQLLGKVVHGTFL